MKTAFQMLLLLAALLTVACREDAKKKEKEKPPTLSGLRFNPRVGETWTYRVDTTFNPSARIPSGLMEMNAEGGSASYQKVRRYLGLKPVEDGSDEVAHCFEVSKASKVSDLEFSLINEKGIYTRAWQEAGKERLINEPLLMVPGKKVPGSVWERSVPNPNDPGGEAMFYRQFQYFGFETVQVLGQQMKARRVKVVGKTGFLQLQRDFWFVDQLGIVKERKGYYSDKERLILVEEILIDHERPAE